MAELVTVTSKDDITILTMQDPPVNSLGGAMRTALRDAFEALPATDKAVVLAGSGDMFCGGVDLRELEPQNGVPSMAEIMDKIEGCRHPVIAAIHGRATGGGMELALACHYRVTVQGTRLGQPEVTLGFPPGGGATQRLPRLIGVEKALRMLLSGGLISDSQALDQGLVDARAKGDLLTFAVQYAKDIVAKDPAPRRTRDRREVLSDGLSNQKIIAKYRKEIAASPMNAPGHIIDCVEAALLLPFDAGIAFEQTAFEDCLNSEQSEALRYMAIADRKARQMPEAKGLTAKPIAKVALLGHGKRAFDQAVALLQAGIEVTLVGPSDSPIPRHVDTWFSAAMAAGRLNEDQVARARSRFSGPVPAEALRNIDLIIDAAPDAAQGFTAVPKEDGTILALARGSSDLSDVEDGAATIGLSFGIPVTKSDLMVLGKGPETSDATVYALAHLGLRLNKQTVICADARVDLSVWMLGIWSMAAETCLRDGATPYQVDTALRALGCKRGPYQLLDLAGLNSLAARMPPRVSAQQPLPGIVEALREAGRLGQSAGKGVYRYDKGNPNGREDPLVVEMTTRLRAERGLPERQISDRAIQRRCLIALANEAARLRTENIVRHCSDLDVVMHHGLGFPRWRGGPVLMADQTGLLAMQRDLRRLADHDPYIWEPAPVLSELIKNGMSLSET